MVLTLLLMIVAGVIAAVFRAEWEAWMPWIAERMRRLALQPLSGELRQRLDEEWASYLGETPGYIGKVVAAIGFNWAARTICLKQWFNDFCFRLVTRSGFGVAKIVPIMRGLLQSIVDCPIPNPMKLISGRIAIWVCIRATEISMAIVKSRIHFLADVSDRQRELVIQGQATVLWRGALDALRGGTQEEGESEG